jgi:hypothetical protein
MKLLLQGYIEDDSSRREFPAVNDAVVCAFIRMLASMKVHRTTNENGVALYVLHLDYGEDYKQDWNITHTLHISFSMPTLGMSAGFLTMFIEASRRLYDELPEDLRDYIGMSPECVSYIVKMIKVIDE